MRSGAIAVGCAAFLVLLLAGCETDTEWDAAADRVVTRKPSAPGTAAVKPAARKTRPTAAAAAPAAPAAAGILAQFPEFEQMAQVAKLEGAQLAAFEAKVRERAEKVERLEKGKIGQQRDDLKKKLTEAQEKNDQKSASALQEKLDAASKEYWDLRTAYRAEVLNQLTPEQKRAWVGHCLFNRLGRSLGRLDLTEEQSRKARAISDQTVAGLMAKGDITQSDPYLKSLVDVQGEVLERIAQKVLTEAQRQRLPSPGAKDAKSK